MDLPLVMAALMNRWGEDILPEEVAYVMEDKTTGSTSNGAFAAAAAGCCGFPCWQAWMDLQDLREQIHDGCSVAVRIERRIRGQRDPIGVWMGLRASATTDAVLADYVLLNDPTAGQRRGRELHDGGDGFCPLLHRAGHRSPPQAPGHRGQPPPAGLLRLCVQCRG